MATFLIYGAPQENKTIHTFMHTQFLRYLYHSILIYFKYTTIQKEVTLVQELSLNLIIKVAKALCITVVLDTTTRWRQSIAISDISHALHPGK